MPSRDSAGKDYTGRIRGTQQPSLILTLGMSSSPHCGIQGYALQIDEQMESLGHRVEQVWVESRQTTGWFSSFKKDALFMSQAVKAMRRNPSGVIFHYSPFAFGAHGLSFLAPLLPVAARLRGVRLTTVLHELCFPWKTAGWRGLIWAIWHRIALVPLMTASTTIIVTTEDRADWSRRAFPGSRTKVATIPVWSSIPTSHQGPSKAITKMEGRKIIGTLGWANQTAAVDLVLDAIALLNGEGAEFDFLLIGEPGSDSPAGRRWKRAADARGLVTQLRFTRGGLSGSEVASFLSAVDVYIHVDQAGPTARRSSLAAALAHGKPTVAIRGPQTWHALKNGEEILLALPDASSLQARIGEVLSSPGLAERLSAGALAAYRREMDLKKSLPLFHSLVLGHKPARELSFQREDCPRGE